MSREHGICISQDDCGSVANGASRLDKLACRDGSTSIDKPVLALIAVNTSSVQTARRDGRLLHVIALDLRLMNPQKTKYLRVRASSHYRVGYSLSIIR